MLRKKKDEKPFATYKITFRNPKSFHLFHANEGITKNMIIDVIRNATEFKEDSRKLRKKIRLFHITEPLTERVRITVIFQLFPNRVHVLNAWLGSFHHKNLYEKMGLKGEVPKKVGKND